MFNKFIIFYQISMCSCETVKLTQMFTYKYNIFSTNVGSYVHLLHSTYLVKINSSLPT